MDEFSEQLMDFMDTLKVGRSLDTQSNMGPVISQRQLDSILSYIKIGQEEDPP
ncbi:aldehyde dehydrogenase family protein [Pseudomonas sp. FW305-E2]|uniref:aldehyde dehydrogenase family protein n=1 Tax=Pseudomonas sp. FW305-E2 TaxID=2075558 RepID=UPI0038573C21